MPGGGFKGHRDRIHRLGFVIAFSMAAVAAPLQIVVGDVAVRRLIEAQPAKFASIELLPKTMTNAPFSVGGRLVDGEVVGAIEIPGLGSFLGTRRLDGEIPGLDSVPDGDRPTDRLATIVHWSFQIMVAIGTGLLLLGIWFGWSWLRRKEPPRSLWFWRIATGAGLLAVVAMEAGWMTTELGRQPWIAQGILRVDEAVTQASGLIWGLVAITIVYLILATVTVLVLRRIAIQLRSGDEVGTPYGPPVETSR